MVSSNISLIYLKGKIDQELWNLIHMLFDSRNSSEVGQIDCSNDLATISSQNDGMDFIINDTITRRPPYQELYLTDSPCW